MRLEACRDKEPEDGEDAEEFDRSGEFASLCWAIGIATGDRLAGDVDVLDTEDNLLDLVHGISGMVVEGVSLVVVVVVVVESLVVSGVAGRRESAASGRRGIIFNCNAESCAERHSWQTNSNSAAT
jgi:hypothetical protein